MAHKKLVVKGLSDGELAKVTQLVVDRLEKAFDEVEVDIRAAFEAWYASDSNTSPSERHNDEDREVSLLSAVYSCALATAVRRTTSNPNLGFGCAEVGMAIAQHLLPEGEELAPHTMEPVLESFPDDVPEDDDDRE